MYFDNIFAEKILSLPNYVKATQDAVVRLNRKEIGKIKGLCTDRLQSCLGIIIKGENRISLIHTDLAVDVGTIIDECRWVSSP